MRRTMWAGLACLAMLVPPAAAKTPPPKDAAASTPEGRPFVEASMVLAPRTVGDWTLVSANDYPGDPASGAAFRYQHRDHPDVRVDLFVYLVGRLLGEDVDKGLDQQIAIVRQGIEQGVRQGSYDAATFEAPVPAWLPPPADPAAEGAVEGAGEGDVDPAPTNAGADAGAGDDAAVAAAIAAVMARDATRDRRVPGRKLAIEMGWNLTPVSSRGYVYYRGLYYFKGRVSASHVSLPTPALDALAEEAMAALVPAIRVASTGGCHGSTVLVDPDAAPAEGVSQLLGGLLASQARAEAENCTATLDDAVPEGFHGIRLDYPAHFWR